MMNPADARERGIVTGDVVRIFNHRGACLAGAIVDDQVMKKVIQLSTGAWFDPLTPGVSGSFCKHGNPNVLTHDNKTSSLSQSPAAHSALVEVTVFRDDPPKITVHSPPKFGKAG